MQFVRKSNEVEIHKFLIVHDILYLPVQVREIAAVEDFEADAVDNFRVFFAGTKLVIRH